MSCEMPFEVLSDLLSFSESAFFCINMHRPIIDTLKENLDQGFKAPGVMNENLLDPKHSQPSQPSQP